MSAILATVPGEVDLVLYNQGGHVMMESTIDRIMADRWLEILLRDGLQWQNMVALVLHPSDQNVMIDLLSNDQVLVDDVINLGKNLLAEAAGRPWWVVFNILAVAEASWDSVGGEMALRGVRAPEVTLGVWLDAVWMLLRRLAGEKNEASLNTLVSEVMRKPFEEGDEGAMDFNDFMTAANELRGPLPS